jgi:hypothetical protein
MATREQILAAHAQNPSAKFYNDPERGVVLSTRDPRGSPEWFEERRLTRKTEASFDARGVPDSCSGNKVYVRDVDGYKVVSGYKPFSNPKWFADARRQGVTRYDD